MAILRAGPWGNLSNSFQDVPGDTGADGLTIYPVNCAKTDWLSGQAWGAYYEVEGCCTPETVSVTYGVVSSMTRLASCNYNEDFEGTPPGSSDYYVQRLEYLVELGAWKLYWDSASWFGESYLYNNDPCDPTGTYEDQYGPLNVVSTP